MPTKKTTITEELETLVPTEAEITMGQGKAARALSLSRLSIGALKPLIIHIEQLVKSGAQASDDTALQAELGVSLLEMLGIEQVVDFLGASLQWEGKPIGAQWLWDNTTEEQIATAFEMFVEVNRLGESLSRRLTAMARAMGTVGGQVSAN